MILVVLRSLAYLVLLYLVMALTFLVTLPVYFFLPQSGSMAIIKWLAGTLARLAERVAGIRYEIRGFENVPAGPSIVAAQHQAMWETFALIPLFPNPTFVIKDELRRVPVWGAFARKVGMIFVDRDKGRAALKALAEGAERAVADGRTIVIFPEGTRVAPGEPAEVKVGLSYLYRSVGLPVVPVALNSGFYWPGRTFLRYPGTIVVEFLPPILPGLSGEEFQRRFKAAIESASDRLILETDRARPRPPFPPEAAARLAVLKAGAETLQA